MQSLAPLDHDWDSPFRPIRLKISLAFALSVLLHLSVLALAAMVWPEQGSHQMSAERTLSVSLVDVTSRTSETERTQMEETADTQMSSATPPREEPAVIGAESAPATAEPVAAPAPEKAQRVRKPVRAMIKEAIKDAPYEEFQATPHDGGTVFDPRLRAKLSAAREVTANTAKSQGLRSHLKSGGSTLVNLGNGKCFEVRREAGLDNREVWWTTSCPPGD